MKQVRNSLLHYSRAFRTAISDFYITSYGQPTLESTFHYDRVNMRH